MWAWLQYEWLCFCRAYSNTIGFIGWNRKTLLISLLFPLGLIIFWRVRGFEAAMDQILVLVSFTILPLGIVFACLFLFNLVRAPYCLYRDQQNQISLSDKEIKQLKEPLLEIIREDNARFNESRNTGEPGLLDRLIATQVKNGGNILMGHKKIAVRNLSQAQTINEVIVSLSHVENHPHLNDKLPRQLHFSNHRTPPFIRSINLNPGQICYIDLIRLEIPPSGSESVMSLCLIDKDIDGTIREGGPFAIEVEAMGRNVASVKKTIKITDEGSKLILF